MPLSTLVPMKHVFLISVGELYGLGFGVVELLDRERLAGKAPLADEEVFGGKHPHVSRNHVAGGQLDNIPGHQIP